MEKIKVKKIKIILWSIINEQKESKVSQAPRASGPVFVLITFGCHHNLCKTTVTLASPLRPTLHPILTMLLARRVLLVSARSKPILYTQARAASSSSHDHHHEDSTVYPAESACGISVHWVPCFL